MFERVLRDGIAVHTVPSLFEECGIGIAFSERIGGTSDGPYESLDLASHVGDDPEKVDANRAKLLEAIGIAALVDHLTTAEQVHGTESAEVTPALAGAGALACGVRPPIPGTDALWTRERGVPLLLMYADCVPVVIASPSIPAVAVVHAGWRGAAAGIAGKVARELAAVAGVQDLRAFIGPHIHAECYTVGEEVAAHFPESCVRRDGTGLHLDLSAAVTADLEASGVSSSSIRDLGMCTACSTDSFYSYRMNGQTGRHGALAVIL